MGDIFILLIVSILVAGGCVGYLFFYVSQQKGGGGGGVSKFREELDMRRGLKEQIESLYSQMSDLGGLRKQGRLLITIKESLKTERGRITITQAELETVEARLRELEEIERELAASNIDTQEEIKILEKKRADLANKNGHLKEQISTSLSQIDAVLGELEMSAQMQEQVQAMKMEILQTQEKIDVLLLQIETGNDQYFVLKKRYDALDIEYAQLYEKFSTTEESQKSGAV